jgi:hypothetical protein
VVDGVTLLKIVGIDQLVAVEEVVDMFHHQIQMVLMVLVGEQEIVTTTLALI